MAKIPRYDSTKTLDVRTTTKEAPAVMANPSAFTAQSQAMRQMGEVVSQVGDKIYQAQADQEFSKASVEAEAYRNQVEIESSQDESYQGDLLGFQKRYKEKLAKGQEQIGQSIKNRQAREKFQRDYEMKALASAYRIQKDGMKRFVAYDKDLMEQEISNAKQRIFAANPPMEAQRRSLEIGSIIKQREGNTLNPAEARNRHKKEMDTLNVEHAEYDIQIDPTVAKAKLEDDFYELKRTKPDEWARLVEKAKAREERLIKEADKLRDEKWLLTGGEVLTDLENKSVDDLVRMVATGQISPKNGKDLIKGKTDPDNVQYETDKKIWLEMARDSVSPEKDLRKFLDVLSEGVANKSIQFSEAAEFAMKIQDLYSSAIAFKTRENPITQAIRTGLTTIENWAKVNTSNPTATAYNMARKLLDKVRGGNLTEKNIEDVSNEIIVEEQKATNPNRAQYQIGRIIKTPTGTWKVVDYDSDGEPIVERE